MQQPHKPANAEQGQNKTAETVQAIRDSFAIGPLGNQSQHDAGEQSKKNGNREMI